MRSNRERNGSGIDGGWAHRRDRASWLQIHQRPERILPRSFGATARKRLTDEIPVGCRAEGRHGGIKALPTIYLESQVFIWEAKPLK